MKIEKRDGSVVSFNKNKIVIAIEKAMKNGSGIIDLDVAQKVADEIEDISNNLSKISIYQVEDLVYNKLISYGHKETAKSYEGYRAIQEYKRTNNTTDDSILGLVNAINEEVMNENSNKNARLASTQRDLIAGEVSKDMISRKMFPSHITQAHESGAIHIHK